MNSDNSKELQSMIEVYKRSGGNEKNLISNESGNIVINENKLLGKNETSGFHVEHKSIKDGIKIKIFIDEGAKIERPIHLCFGMLSKEGKQLIKSEFFIGKNAKASFFAHCLFPNAKNIQHVMDSKVHIGENAEMSYYEEHYHSENGAMVYPKLRGKIEKGGKLLEEFKLVKGRVGTLKIDYEVDQGERSSCELFTKVYGKKDDNIEVREAIHLNGKYASGMTKSRIVLVDRAFGNVFGEIEGNYPYTRGHVDCHEIVQGKGAKAVSTPKISVKTPLSRVTHESAIGRINKKELETLMARGLTEDEAVDLIVNKLLK